MAFTPSDNFPELLDAMKRAAAALRDAEVPYLLGGGLAAWARGGPPTEHDIDFFVREEDAERALATLEAAGMKPERPPEDWLLKAWDGDTLIDLIFSPMGGGVDQGYFDRADEMEVAAQRMLVASLGDVLATKLLALNEQEPDLTAVLELARSLREQIDWEFVRERTADSPFARAFFTLVEELGVVEARLGLEEELLPGFPPGRRLDADRAPVEPLDTRVEAQPVGRLGALELDLDLARAAGVVGRHRLQVGERLLRALPRSAAEPVRAGSSAQIRIRALA